MLFDHQFRIISLLAVFLLPACTFAQAAATPSPTPVNLARDIVHDQKAIWTSPARIKKRDFKWIAPLALGTAELIATDRTTSRRVSLNGSLPGTSKDVSFIGSVYATAGVAGGFYIYGRAAKNDHARETGRLAAEALIDTFLITQAVKFAAGRRRPSEDDGRGRFWKGGSSFPSGHSSSAWAVATVVAYQYRRRPWIKYSAFALATLVSMSRYSGRKHFLSDVAVGSAIGFGIGRFVYRSHH